MKGQKEFVVEQVKQVLGGRFVPYQTKAIVALSNAELEAVKAAVEAGIIAGNVDYSKDRSNKYEVRTYARSMVMNHLKKAKELNGNLVLTRSGVSTVAVPAKAKETGPKINLDILPDYMKSYLSGL